MANQRRTRLTTPRRSAAPERRTAVLDAITYAATRLIAAEDWKPAMPELLARLGAATDVSRVFLFEIHPAPDGCGLAQSCRFSWSAPGLAPIAGDSRVQNMPLSEAPDSQLGEWFHRRRRGEVIQVTASQTFGDARRLFEETGTRSMLSVPILVAGEFWGSLGFDDCRSERIWDEVEVDLLKTATALVAGAIARAKAEEKMRESETLLVEAQRIAHVGSWVLDFDTDTVRWSNEGWRIFGLDPDRGAWSHDENLQHIHPEDRDRVARADAAAKERGLPLDIEYRVIRPSGEVRVLHERAEVVSDAAGRRVRLIGTVHDITEQKVTEARLRESEERYALAARGADVGLLDWDIVADRAYLSPRLHEIVGVEEGALGTSMAALLDRFVPGDGAALRQHLEARFERQRRRFEVEARLRRSEDDLRWILVRGLILYADGRPVRIVGSVRDDTDRKRAQEELMRQRETLHQSEKMAMFGSLLAGVAHELNNPLSVVIGQVALLQQTTHDASVIKRAERIRAATERCARIVRTFLAMARQRRAEPRPVVLNSIIEMSLDLLAYQLRSADIRVETDLTPDPPPVTADADQLHQVVTNLLVNAHQALLGVSGPRTLRLSTRYDRASGTATLSVADNGPGIPAEIRPRIFEPFFTTKAAGEGTGIGLSLCASIVRAHGGQIAVSESAGGGATFTVALPLQPHAALAARDARIDHAATGLRILIVDDEAEIADTLSEILQGEGHETDVAADGRQALDRILAGDYDLILSDLRMPALDGPGLHRALAERRPEMVERLAFITGDSLSAEAQAFLAQSSAPYLEKPFLPEDVTRLVSRLVTDVNAPGSH